MNEKYYEIVGEWLGRKIENVLDPGEWFGSDGIFAKMNDAEIIAFQQILARDESIGDVWDVMTAGPEGWIEALIKTITA